MDEASRVERIIAPAVTALGYEVVRVHLSGVRHPVVQVMAERVDRAGMTVDDCAALSRSIAALLDAEDPIRGSYTLEVSSPGIDRPLTRLGDYERFAGSEAKIETRVPVDGRRRFRGLLRGVVDRTIRIDCAEGPADVPYDDIQRAKLVLTEALMAAAARGKEKA